MTNLCTWSAILAYVSCHIQKDQMKIPVDIRGAFEASTLETITQDNLNYMANGGIRVMHNCSTIASQSRFLTFLYPRLESIVR